MTYFIRKAAVIGAGTMGGGIAALLVGLGIETVLLDIPPVDSRPGDLIEKRNAMVLEGIKRLRNSRPAALFHESDADLIQVGNLEDDLHLLRDVDWVVEAVVEKLDVKQALMARISRVVKPEAIISTNTSGIPLRAIAEHMDAQFKRRFIGTHFFNPPRYLKLLEIIPHAETDPEVVEFMMDFGSRVLGKGVVLCKDTPNFIANRISSFSGSFVRNYMLDNNLTIEEVDVLTGPLIGRPKTATFRLQDLVGFDTSRFVVQNLYSAVLDDPAREVLNHSKMNALAAKLINSNRLGNKTGQGFYKQVKNEQGTEYWPLNLDTFEYEPPKNPTFESVQKHAQVQDTGERIRLLMQEQDKVGRFLWHLFAFDLTYASQRIPEITDTILDLDNAVKWGFNRELGPFEIWDILGVKETIPQFEAAGYPLADWVKAMVSAGYATFYQRGADHRVTGYYSPQDKKYLALEGK
jgi:3-hydroxyacyl-CoA dehydrogenase